MSIVHDLSDMIINPHKKYEQCKVIGEHSETYSYISRSPILGQDHLKCAMIQEVFSAFN